MNFEVKFSRKFNILSFLTCAFALSMIPAFIIGTFNYDRENPLFYTPIITLGLTILFGVWLMKLNDKEIIKNDI